MRGKKKKEKTEKRKGRRFSGGRGEEGAKGRREKKKKKKEADALILGWPSLFFINSFSSLQIFSFETISEFLEKHSRF